MRKLQLPILTVFTPTFNRAYCLHQCYESLTRQTCKNFLWLVIDDGSTDNTKEIVQRWAEEADFVIRYVYKENGGMHTAHNTAYENIDTELNVCIDSDDYMTDNAVETIITFWKQNGDDTTGGIYALDGTPDGKVIGEAFPNDLNWFKGYGCKEIFYGKNKRYKVKGDKKFISVTKRLKEYPPIPVFEGEKYYSLYYKQHFIERDYKILILNKIICIVEYLPDGSSMNMFKQYMLNPKGFSDIRKIVMQLAPSFKLRFQQEIHYVSINLIARNFSFISESPRKLETILAIPLGLMLFLYIKKNINRKIQI